MTNTPYPPIPLTPAEARYRRFLRVPQGYRDSGLPATAYGLVRALLRTSVKARGHAEWLRVSRATLEQRKARAENQLRELRLRRRLNALDTELKDKETALKRRIKDLEYGIGVLERISPELTERTNNR